MAITRLGTYGQLKGTSYKLPCRLATTLSITLSAPPATVDGITTVTGDRILVWKQSNAAENGIYVVGTAWTRDIDFSIDDDAINGIQVYVNEGVVNSKRIFVLENTGVITLGTTLLVFNPLAYLTQSIYTSDGTLASNRTVTMSGYTLSFTGDLLVNGLTIGKGSGTGAANAAVGASALANNTTGFSNASFGSVSLYSNTTGFSNLGIGVNALYYNTTGNSNVALGINSLISNTTGSVNVGIGRRAGQYLTDKTTAVTIIDNSVLIGYRTSPLGNNQTNQIVIGYDANGLGSNTTVLGNTSTLTTAIYGNLLLGTTVNNGVDSLQVNGSLIATTIKIPALTDGSVLFSNGTTIAQDNANLFWDDTNNRLGIGTNAPTVPLDVNGRVFISTGTEGAFIAPLVVKNTISYQSPFTQFIQIWQNNINQNILTLRTDGSLTLAGSNSTYNSSFFLSNNNGNGTSLLTFARGNNGFWFPSGNSLGINTNGAEKLRVLSTGEVTIGATTAGARLDVRAQGALSTDIAFRVRNSADTTDLTSINGLGNSVFSNDSLINGLTVGRGKNSINTNTAFGFQSLISNTSATSNTSVGFQALASVTTGSTNTAIGSGSMRDNISGLENTALGVSSLLISSGNRNTAIGFNAGNTNTSGANNIFIGWNSTGVLNTESNRSWIGHSAITSTWLAGSVLIGTTTDAASAILNVNSTTKGFLPPRMTNAQRLAIASPAIALMVYCTDTVEGLYINKSTGWQFIV